MLRVPSLFSFSATWFFSSQPRQTAVVPQRLTSCRSEAITRDDELDRRESVAGRRRGLVEDIQRPQSIHGKRRSEMIRRGRRQRGAAEVGSGRAIGGREAENVGQTTRRFLADCEWRRTRLEGAGRPTGSSAQCSQREWQRAVGRSWNRGLTEVGGVVEGRPR